MENETLEVHDNDPSTKGGAPAWLAWMIVFVLFFVAGLGLLAFWYFMA